MNHDQPRCLAISAVNIAHCETHILTLFIVNIANTDILLLLLLKPMHWRLCILIKALRSFALLCIKTNYGNNKTKPFTPWAITNKPIIAVDSEAKSWINLTVPLLIACIHHLRKKMYKDMEISQKKKCRNNKHGYYRWISLLEHKSHWIILHMDGDLAAPFSFTITGYPPSFGEVFSKQPERPNSK